jgi:glucose 1-dehydrogenase
MKRKIAIVTGSSKGIGKAIALAFANSKQYSGIVVNARKINEAKTVSDQIRTLDCDSIAIEADISKESDCVRLIEQTVKQYGRIDVLVNNAGIQEDLPLTEISIDEWYRILGVDLTGPFICSREAVKIMKRQQSPTGGCIINISSVHQAIPKPHYIPYATSKAGIEMMTKTMALELAKDNIGANVIAPGAIETDMNMELKENEDELNKVLKRIPIGRVGQAEEVAYL